MQSKTKAKAKKQKKDKYLNRKKHFSYGFE